MNRSLPPAVYVIALGIFCLGTSEFMIAGLLLDLSTDLGVSIPDAGMLITAFALGMMIGAPILTLATLRLPRKATLLAAVAVFAVAHVIGALTDSYGVLLATRVVSAAACATYWAVGSVLAVRLSPDGQTARAMAVTVGGLTLANIVGVPAGTWIGEHFGWQASFFAVAGVTVLSGLLTIAAVREPEPQRQTQQLGERLRAELHAFRKLPLWLALATTMLFQSAVFCAFSYLAPLLTDVAGISVSQVPIVLLLFGIGSFIGITIGGRYADRGPLRNVIVSLIAMSVSFVVLIAMANSAVGAVVAAFLFGLTAFSIAAALNSRVFALAGDAPTLSASVNVSAFNAGNTIGPWLGGALIGGGLGFVAPVWGALALGLGALSVATVSWRIEDNRQQELVEVSA